ncbi:ImmA/IrrE family metallo-endopeptidase [uncultured Sneathiella sp.]|uniref:ImmA/IrrE family metallo-endopeptidase n=1 Tax=uncultured Sneathiella sp. TaxID=879315 RepID=UPI00259AB4AD|nr:ImmA/IrrE family metallo-endopeptidase [uncultured Sneathiella sp.]
MKAFRPAERILMELGIRSPSDIDLEAIAWFLGAAVRYRPLEKCEATIVGSDRRAIITVNSHSIPVRKRFSIGHEIGHWHHHRGRILYCGAGDIGNPTGKARALEKQADQFASDLILPDFMFNPRINKIKQPSLSAIREVANDFQASVTATLLKLVEGNQFPVMVVCHNKMRRRWFKRARMIPDYWFPRNELDHDSLAFDILFGSTVESKYPQKVGADAWFDFRGAESYEIKEQSMMLPNEEILTLLSLDDAIS